MNRVAIFPSWIATMQLCKSITIQAIFHAPLVETCSLGNRAKCKKIALISLPFQGYDLRTHILRNVLLACLLLWPLFKGNKDLQECIEFLMNNQGSQLDTKESRKFVILPA